MTSCHQCSAGALSRPSSRWRVSVNCGSRCHAPQSARVLHVPTITRLVGLSAGRRSCPPTQGQGGDSERDAQRRTPRLATTAACRARRTPPLVNSTLGTAASVPASPVARIWLLQEQVAPSKTETGECVARDSCVMHSLSSAPLTLAARRGGSLPDGGGPCRGGRGRRAKVNRRGPGTSWRKPSAARRCARATRLCLGIRSERLAEIRDRMSRPGTATTASTCLRLFRFFGRGAKGHRQLVTAWVENRILTTPLYPDGCCAPFAVRYSLPWRHVNHLTPTSIL
jgi:hypothetical protein